MKKRIISFVMAILVLSSVSTSVFASELYDEDAGAYIGPVIAFDESGQRQNDQGVSAPSRVAKAKYNKGDLICKWSTGSTFMPDTVRYYAYFYSSQDINQKFVKYLTSSWAKAQSYTWSKANTTSFTINGQVNKEFAKKIVAAMGLSLSHSTTYTVAITIPADASRFSKLGFASDYTRVSFDYKVENIMGGGETTTRESIDCPEDETYLIVYYQ